MKRGLKLGLLFLVKETDVRQPVLWQRFISSSEREVFSYCHPKIPLDPKSFLFGAEILERHETSWGRLGIVYAMFALLRAAFENSDLTHFLFVSESCIPIKSWNDIKNELANDPRSRIDLQGWEGMSASHRSRRCSAIEERNWHLHPQWMLLDRRTALFLLKHVKSLESFRGVFCPDEHAVGTLLSMHKYDMLAINHAPTTWVQWNGGNHPQTIFSITPDLKNQWTQFRGFCARKLAAGCDVSNFSCFNSLS